MSLAQQPVRRFSGAWSSRVIDPSHADVAEHAHDWPVLSLYVLGAYRNRSVLGEAHISAPSAVFYASGAAHANRAGPDGFEQLEVEFDPAWLGLDFTLPTAPVCRRVGGPAGAAARALARLWSSPDASEAALRAATGGFLRVAFASAPARRPAWVDRIAARLAEDPAARLASLAGEVGLHPDWLGQAYRAATGETIGQAATRRRVGIAARLLRETQAPQVQVALEAGFCDQSHMIRAFRRTLGRTPASIRLDRTQLRTSESSNRPAPDGARPRTWTN